MRTDKTTFALDGLLSVNLTGNKHLIFQDLQYRPHYYNSHHSPLLK